MPAILRLLLVATLLAALPGCTLLLPATSTMPVVRNPFPQLRRVAVAPFFNLSDEPTVDGRLFAQAYFAELQATAGFEVVPLGVVEEAMIAEQIDLASAGEARRLAQVLGVDAIVVGAVTDFDPYYPPRCGMRVEWYAANPGFHRVPAGYGLPWGTPDEEYIPSEVVYQAELELATAQMATQSPQYTPDPPPAMPQRRGGFQPIPSQPVQPAPLRSVPDSPKPEQSMSSEVEAPSPMSSEGDASPHQWRPHAGAAVSHPTEPSRGKSPDADGTPQERWHDEDFVRRDGIHRVEKPGLDDSLAMPAPVTNGIGGTIAPQAEEFFVSPFPPDWPDPRGFSPPGPQPVRPPLMVNHGPVMTHTRVFHGHDPEFTTALAAYVDFRDDARFGGWRAYLTRSNDFIRFCCHLHIVEMLGARGGATETRVVRDWSDCR